MLTIVGNCPRCGAPIYAESPWYSVLPPPSRHSCGCFPEARVKTASSTRADLED